MSRAGWQATTAKHSLRNTRFAFFAAILTACGPTITPLSPRGPVPVATDVGEPGTAAVALIDAEYFDGNSLMVPVAGIAPSALRDSFNAPRSGGRAHRALDIPARRGTPALAAADGTILSMRQNTLGGTTLYLVDSQRRFVYYYAHLDRYHDRMSEGVEVRQGQVLGYVGTSGNAPRDFPHLHFQALRVDSGRRDWWNGPPVDVRAFFQIAGREREL